jgi:hypothetical protein
MADIVIDGMVRVDWVPSISNNSAPTTTELNAGIALTTLITDDGLIGWEAETADVPTTPLSGTFDTVDVGRVSFSNTALRIKKQSGTDTTYTTLVKNASGYIVIRRNTAYSTAWASSQQLEVFPVKCGETKYVMPAANTLSRYEVPMKITSAPTMRATVA